LRQHHGVSARPKPRRNNLPRAAATACRSITLPGFGSAKRSISWKVVFCRPRQDRPPYRDEAVRASGLCRRRAAA
jgi:hypothetical protein